MIGLGPRKGPVEEHVTTSMPHGVVSTGHIWWEAPKTWVKRAYKPPCCSGLSGEGTCNTVLTGFIDAGKKASSWTSGKTWGLRLYDNQRTAASDVGALSTLQLDI